MSTDIRTWITALLTLGVYSFLVRDNRLFRLIEKFFVGIGAGYYAALGLKSVIQVGIAPIKQGRYITLIPLILGLLVYARYFKSIAWVSKIPVAIIVAVGAALTLRGTVQAQFIDQIAGTLLPWNSINNVLLVLGTTCTVLYFYFRARPEGSFDTAMNWAGKFARFVMMFSFGIGFTGVLGANIPRTIGQIKLIFGQWIHLIPGI
ncbi:MAG TPA: hypothetical protein GXX30_01020 [Firmicutes bacterium]|nr:hypothetical protein [Candidatus Fermentithermobacillaceae bacterium]